MKIYPAIDLLDGACVRLLRGDFDKKTVYSLNPAETAKSFVSAGAENIHVVDLNAARDGRGKNRDAIGAICAATGAFVECGGGVRSVEDAKELFEIGVSRVILGTAALYDAKFLQEAVSRYGDKIAVGIDAKDGFVATDGWEKVSAVNALDFAARMKAVGIGTIIYTDIATDGTLKGPNLEAMEQMVRESGLDVIASGGVGSNRDILSLKQVGVAGVIVGRAMYSGSFDLKKAILEANE
ncbi:MAG: 1-(5-phosphoribosyl)-5-[(5-phosphoribosylamino)methylideneamino]imidazole-4-carboxamide isomerase [Clostridia bacterium]|nr:1-(5-phosphoribosyl)-5-[(5-phosphoribosylamino)methylideneamino]imidazole-4-carboxamide isomerase [Clostridia bacterium]